MPDETLTPPTISRTEAIARGLTRYTGKPCKYGHGTERRVWDWKCVFCVRQRGTRWAAAQYQQNPEKYRAAAKQWRETHLDEARARGRERYADDPERYGAQAMREWRAANPENVRASNRAQYLKNREARLAARAEERRRNPEMLRKRVRKWQQANPNRMVAYAAARRARLGKPAWADLDAIMEIYLDCPDGMVVDHIVPLDGRTIDGYEVSGLHIALNLQYLTAASNGRKRNKMRQADMQLCEV
jgi:hypothetical protein